MNKQPLIQQIIRGMQDSVRPSDYWKVSKVELPELEAAQLIIQQDGKSVWQHTMKVIDLLTIKNPITLLSGLFHDLGKSYVYRTYERSLTGRISRRILRFPGHNIKSADIAKIRLIEWQASPYLIDRVIRIILTHMYDINNGTQEKTIRKFVADVGLDNIENWFVVRKADSQSYSKYNRYKRYMIDPFYKSVRHYLDRLPSKDNSLQLSLEPNIIMNGKECENNNIYLLLEGEQN